MEDDTHQLHADLLELKTIFEDLDTHPNISDKNDIISKFDAQLQQKLQQKKEILGRSSRTAKYIEMIDILLCIIRAEQTGD